MNFCVEMIKFLKSERSLWKFSCSELCSQHQLPAWKCGVHNWRQIGSLISLLLMLNFNDETPKYIVTWGLQYQSLPCKEIWSELVVFRISQFFDLWFLVRKRYQLLQLAMNLATQKVNFQKIKLEKKQLHYCLLLMTLSPFGCKEGRPFSGKPNPESPCLWGEWGEPAKNNCFGVKLCLKFFSQVRYNAKPYIMRLHFVV